MAERRRHRRSLQGDVEEEEEKLDTAVAKYLRFKCPTKSSSMMGQRVEYFTGSRAVDVLLESDWATGRKGAPLLFTSRDTAVHFCNKLLQREYFSRGLKIARKSEREKEGKREDEKKGKKDEKVRERGKEKKDKDKKKEKETEERDETNKDKKDEDPGSPKKKRKKMVLHEDQVFLDGNEIYVWSYDPVHFKTFALGLFVVVGVIAATLFPLWPAGMKVGVYYLSVSIGCFVGGILIMAVARCILFFLIWLLTCGRHHLWILPNLTADVGFLDSFRPLFTYEYRVAETKKVTCGEGDKSDEGSASSAMMVLEADEQNSQPSSEHSSGNDFEVITRGDLDGVGGSRENSDREESSNGGEASAGSEVSIGGDGERPQC
uniref:translocation protein SEC62-like n=1 Tax=Myxine glutinosa TaxID=7769 RepID=UPI00358E2632